MKKSKNEYQIYEEYIKEDGLYETYTVLSNEYSGTYSNLIELIERGKYIHGEKYTTNEKPIYYNSETFEEYYKGGGIKEKGFILDGKKNGKYVIYKVFKSVITPLSYSIRQGDEIESGVYVEGKKDGEYRIISFSRLKEKGSYRKGMKNGPYEIYKENRVIEKGTYIDGVKEGKYIEYNNRIESGSYFNGIKSGPYIETIGRNNDLREKGNYIDGKKNGFYENYLGENQLTEKGTYVNNKEEGKYEQYSNGRLLERGVYLDGKKNGGYKIYNKSTLLEEEGTYVNNTKKGQYKQYYKNGELKEVGKFQYNNKFGKFKSFSIDGNLVEKGMYINGHKSGPFEQINKENVEKGVYLRDKRCTEYILYYENNNIKEKGFSLNDDYRVTPISIKEWIVEEFFNDGDSNEQILKEKTLYHNGFLIGIIESYFDNGNVKIKRGFLGGNEDIDHKLFEKNILREYYENGKLKEKISFSEIEYSYNHDISYLRNGEYEKFNPEGIIETKGIYKDNLKEGVWKTYYESGHIKEKISFIEGFKVGLYESFYKNGQLESTGKYIKDSYVTYFRDKEKLHTFSSNCETWYYYYENGKLKLKESYSYKDNFYNSRSSYHKNSPSEEYDENGHRKKT